LIGAKDLFPYIEDAIRLLGFDKIEEYKYHTSNIKKALDIIKIKSNTDNIESKIRNVLYLKDDFKNGVFYSSNFIKEYLKETYDNLNLNLTGLGSDINKYYLVQEASKRIDSVKTRGYIILHKK